MTDTGLDNIEITKIRAVFSRHPEVERAVLYGSRAMGRHKPHSDIDLSLIGDISMDVQQQIEFELDDLLLPYKFDVSVFHKITNPEFTAHIDRVGMEFYVRK